jgi:hypothetical protein
MMSILLVFIVLVAGAGFMPLPRAVERFLSRG